MSCFERARRVIKCRLDSFVPLANINKQHSFPNKRQDNATTDVRSCRATAHATATPTQVVFYVACSFAASISVRHSVVETVASIGLLLLVADVDSTIELRMDTRKLLHRRRRALLGLKKPGVARPLKGSHRGFA